MGYSSEIVDNDSFFVEEGIDPNVEIKEFIKYVEDKDMEGLVKHFKLPPESISVLLSHNWYGSEHVRECVMYLGDTEFVDENGWLSIENINPEAPESNRKYTEWALVSDGFVKHYGDRSLAMFLSIIMAKAEHDCVISYQGEDGQQWGYAIRRHSIDELEYGVVKKTNVHKLDPCPYEGIVEKWETECEQYAEDIYHLISKGKTAYVLVDELTNDFSVRYMDGNWVPCDGNKVLFHVDEIDRGIEYEDWYEEYMDDWSVLPKSYVNSLYGQFNGEKYSDYV